MCWNPYRITSCAGCAGCSGGQKKGAWLSVPTSMVNGMKLGDQEWRDDLFLCYNIDPPPPPTPQLKSIRGTIIITSLPILKEGRPCHHSTQIFLWWVANLASKGFTPSHVHDDPLIHTVHMIQGAITPLARSTAHKNPKQVPEDTEKKGDIFIWYLYQKGTDSVQGMCVVNTDSTS